jgi:adenylate kinase
MTELNLVLLGPPGAGKGTQAARLRDDLGLPYLSTGDLLRRHRADGTELGLQAASYMAEGQLVPDELVISMLMHAVENGPSHGFLLDGFPRTVIQADALEAVLAYADRELRAVLLIYVPDEVIIERISGRMTCPRGHVFHIRNAPPERGGVCDHDGEPLARRDDDQPETVSRRLDVYHEQTAPLVTYYEQRGLLVRVDGTRAPDEVFATIRTALEATVSNQPG